MYQSLFNDKTLGQAKREAREETERYLNNPADEEAEYYCRKTLEELYIEIGVAYFLKHCHFSRDKVDIAGLIAYLDIYGLDLLDKTPAKTILTSLAAGMSRAREALNIGYILPREYWPPEPKTGGGNHYQPIP